MRQRRRAIGAALMFGGASVLMAAGPVYADDPGLPQAPGAPQAPDTSKIPGADKLPKPSDTDKIPGADKLPKPPAGVPGLPGSDSGGGSSGGSSGGGGESGGSSGGSSASGGGSGGSDAGGGSKTGKEVQVPYQCKTPIGDKSATSPVQIDAAKSGEGYQLTVKFSKSVMDSPAQIQKGQVKPSMAVKVGGDDKGTAQVEGPTNEKAIKQGDPIEIPDLKGPYKPGAKGKATLTPGVLTVKAMGTTTTCTPSKDPGPSVTVETSDEGGTSGGGSAGGGGAAGGSSGGAAASGGGGSAPQSAGGSGGLAETGASDNGSLEALGLVGGTVVLLGGAVFTFTPWRRLTR